MINPRCHQCAYFEETAKGHGGDCRRHPPIGQLVMQQQLAGNVPAPVAFWPPVQLNHWCGEFEQAGPKVLSS